MNNPFPAVPYLLGALLAWAGLCASAPVAWANDVFAATFLHKAYAGTLSFNWTRIDHPFLDARHDALLFVTPNQNPGGGSALELLNIGVWYDATTQRWNVFHQDQTTPIAAGVSYNVLRAASSADAFVHTADPANIVGNYTLVDHPSLNGDPSALFVATPSYNPPGSLGFYDDHAIGVFYSVAYAKWAIFNQDIAAMPPGAAFNVLVLDDARYSHLHTADVLNTTGNRTYIDHPAVNGRPDILLQVTHNWNAGGSPGVYNDHPLGVFYDDVQDRWAITNMDGLSIPLGSHFNVLIPPSLSTSWIDLVDASDPTPPAAGADVLTHPLIDGELSPILLTTPLLGAFGSGSTYTQDEVALAYDSGIQRWYLRNQWGPSWSPISVTNVHHAPSDLRAFVHQAGTGNQPYTIVRHPLLDFDADAIFFVQPHMNPADGPIVTIPERVGVVHYDFGSGDEWYIQNEPFTLAIADNASYNVYIPPPEAGAFKHTTAPLDGSSTVIDHPSLNGDPTAVLLVTHNVSDSPDQWLDKSFGVRYDYGLDRWTIATVDNSSLGDQTFNVVRVPEPGLPLMLASGTVLLCWLSGRRAARDRSTGSGTGA